MDTVVPIAAQLANQLPDEDVDHLIEARIQSLHDPYGQVAVAHRAANFALFGKPPQSFEEMEAAVRDTDRDTLRTAFEDFHSSLLLGVPGDAKWTRLPKLTPPESKPVVPEIMHRSLNWPGDRRQLVFDAHGLEIADTEIALRADFADSVGLLRYPDGFRYLMRSDGYGVGLEPREWHEGSAAVAELDRRVPAHLHLDQPPRDPLPDVRRLNVFKRWQPQVVRVFTARATILSALIGLTVLAALAFILSFNVLALALMVFVGRATWSFGQRST